MASDACRECNKPVVSSFFRTQSGGKVHAEVCWAERKQKASPKCFHCGQVVMAVKGKFSGRYFNAEGSAHEKVHEECWKMYNLKKAAHCDHCKEAILHVPNRFSGRFLEEPGTKTKVHAECLDAFRMMRAARCDHCNDPITPIEGKYSGASVTMDGATFHSECYEEAHQKKVAASSTGKPCAHCGQVIEGECYESTTHRNQRLHLHCKDAFLDKLKPPCCQCGLKIDDEVAHVNDDVMHPACVDMYRKARLPRCDFCKKTIEGQFYTVESGAQLHLDCFELYVKDKMLREYG